MNIQVSRQESHQRKYVVEVRVIIPSTRNKGLQNVLTLDPVISLIPVCCSLNTFTLSVEFPQNAIPYCSR